MRQRSLSLPGLLAGAALFTLTLMPAPAQDILQVQTSQSLLGGSRPLLSGPLSLAEAVRIARETSLEVQIAEQDTRMAEADVRSARSARLPLIALGAAYTLANAPFFYTVSSGPGNIPRGSSGEFNLALSLPLFTGGRLDGQEARVAAERVAAQHDLVATRRAAVLAVQEAYYRALLARAQVEVYRDYVAQREAALGNSRERFAIGKVPRVYVLRDETELAAARRTLLAARTLLEATLADLKRGLGVSPASDFTLSDRLEAQGQPRPLEALLGTVKNHPALAASRARVQAGEALMEVASGAFLPQVNLYAQGEVRTPQAEGFGSGGSLVVAATLPVLDFGGRSAEVERAGAALTKARLQLEAREAELAQATTRAWLEAKQAAETIALTRAAVRQAEEENRLSRERFAVGRSIQVEVLDSGVALLKAQLENLVAVHDLALAQARLEQLTEENPP